MRRDGGHADRATHRAWLQTALRDLPPREEQIIRARHLAERTTTLAELGRTLGISKERVRQLESRALQKLHRELG